ncbi:hydrolase [Trichosporon asahii var. asahii CBS 8904]|uniref:Hydrolase n=1 Tax=Trichosporon asahii var. asahii (strain CBS 8904) TaxID=1220162 RepID=K1WJR6_TRIAC|nr:hydrolase [Trichosporon asahii var. asahii CBS 8904]
MSAPETLPAAEPVVVTSEVKEELPCDIATLKTFEFDRILSEATTELSIQVHSRLTPGPTSAYLYGALHGEPAIIHVARTSLDTRRAPQLVKEGLENLDVFLDNRPYFSAHALLQRTPDSLPDLALKLIWPATPVHVKKYTSQPRKILHETPETYKTVVEPYIESFPPERLEWVRAILEGRKEAERVVYRSPELPLVGADGTNAAVEGDKNGNEGVDNTFVLVPDLKWDGTTVRQLYLTAIAGDGRIRSLRDLRAEHLSLLKAIRKQAYVSAKEKYGVEKGDLRMFIHYQPSYYHFHVHIVHVAHDMLAGMAVGQAHLLDDVINWLEIAPDLPQKLTLTYALGVEHGLYAALAQAPENQADPTASGVNAASAGPDADTDVDADGAETDAADEDGERDAKRRRV